MRERAPRGWSELTRTFWHGITSKLRETSLSLPLPPCLKLLSLLLFQRLLTRGHFLDRKTDRWIQAVDPGTSSEPRRTADSDIDRGRKPGRILPPTPPPFSLPRPLTSLSLDHPLLITLGLPPPPPSLALFSGPLRRALSPPLHPCVPRRERTGRGGLGEPSISAYQEEPRGDAG